MNATREKNDSDSIVEDNSERFNGISSELVIPSLGT